MHKHTQVQNSITNVSVSHLIIQEGRASVPAPPDVSGRQVNFFSLIEYHPI